MKIIRICLYRFLLIFIASVPVNLCAAGEMQKYSDEKNKISFSYPSGWKQMTPAEAKSLGGITGKYLTVIIYDPKDWTQNVNVQILYPVAAQDLTEAGYKKFQKRFDLDPSKMPGFRKISAKVGKRSDMAMLEVVYESIRPDGVRIQQKAIRTGKAGRELVITFTSRADIYHEIDKLYFSIILNTLKVD